MSKTIQTQIDKSQTLLNGLRKNASEVSERGITNTSLVEMEEKIKQLSVANQECDALRAELSEKVRTMNRILAEVKEQFISKKKVIKMNYPQENWIKFGVIDKR